MNSYFKKNIYDAQSNVTSLKKCFDCGCVKIYEYPNCTKQDLVHGGCTESCACFKYVNTYIHKCDVHTNCTR